ncbi:MAG: hypothetical protein ACQEQD_10710 [Bacillota bacterium]
MIPVIQILVISFILMYIAIKLSIKESDSNIINKNTSDEIYENFNPQNIKEDLGSITQYKLSHIKTEKHIKRINEIINFVGVEIRKIKRETYEYDNKTKQAGMSALAGIITKTDPTNFLLASEAIKRSSEALDWRGKGGVSRLRTHLDQLNKYKKVIQGKTNLSKDKTIFKFTTSSLNKILDFIKFRKQEIKNLMDENIITKEDYDKFKNRFDSIKKITKNEIKEMKKIPKLINKPKKKIKKAKTAYNKGYIDQKQYNDKIKEIIQNFKESHLKDF